MVMLKVRIKIQMIRLLPRFKTGISLAKAGVSLETAKYMMDAGTTKFTIQGIVNVKNSVKCNAFCCQTKKVEIPPKGLIVPPALAATTAFNPAKPTNLGLAFPITKIMYPINKPTVKLLITVDNIKANPPVIQNNCR